MTAVGVSRSVLGLADDFTQLQNRLRTVIDEERELVAVTSSLFDIAADTRQAVGGTVELYTRLALASKDLSVSQEELLDLVGSVNRAVALSGATASEASAGLIQLGQGIGSGALRGDELRSVLEQIPVVADVIADSLGVTRGELRKLGSDGRITADVVLTAFREAGDDLEARFGKAVPTVAQGVVVLRNEILAAVAGLDKQADASRSVADFTLDAAEAVKLLSGRTTEASKEARDIAAALEFAGDAATVLGVTVGTRFLVGGIQGASAFAARVIEAGRAAQATATATVVAGSVIDRGFSTTLIRQAAAADRSLTRLSRTARGLRGAFGAIGLPNVTTALGLATGAAIAFGDELADALVKGRKEARRLASAVDSAQDALFRLRKTGEKDLGALRGALEKVFLEASRVQEAGGVEVKVSAAVPDDLRERFEADFVAQILAANPAVEDAARELAKSYFLAVDRSLVAGGDPTRAADFLDLENVLRDLQAQGTLTGDAIAERFNILRAPVRAVIDFAERGIERLDKRIASKGAVEERTKATREADEATARALENVEALVAAIEAETAEAGAAGAELLQLRNAKLALAAATKDGVEIAKGDVEASAEQVAALARVEEATRSLVAARDRATVEGFVADLEGQVAALEAEQKGLTAEAELLRRRGELLDGNSAAFEENRDRMLELLKTIEELERRAERGFDFNLDGLDFDVDVSPLEAAAGELEGLRRRVIDLSGDGSVAAEAMARFARSTREISPDEAASFLAVVRQIGEAEQDLRTLQARDLIANVEAEVALLGKTEAQRRTALELTRLQVDAESDLGQSIEATFERLDLAERVRDGASGAAGAFGNFLRDARDGVDDIGDALEGLAFDVVGELSDAFVIDPLVAKLQAGLESLGADVLGLTTPLQAGSATAAGRLTAAGAAVAAEIIAGATTAAFILSTAGQGSGGKDLVSGVVGDIVGAIPGIGTPPAAKAKGDIAPFADGSTFMDSQTITAFRKGGGLAGATRGFVDTPTLFPLGLAGEAGPEAILPLLQDGRLPILGSDISLALKRDSAGVLRAAIDDPRAFAAGEAFTTSIAPRVEVSAIAPPSDRTGRSLAPSVEMGTLQRQLDGLAVQFETLVKATRKGAVPRDRSGLTDRQVESDRARNRSFTRGRL